MSILVYYHNRNNKVIATKIKAKSRNSPCTPSGYWLSCFFFSFDLHLCILRYYSLLWSFWNLYKWDHVICSFQIDFVVIVAQTYLTSVRFMYIMAQYDDCPFSLFYTIPYEYITTISLSILYWWTFGLFHFWLLQTFSMNIFVYMSLLFYPRGFIWYNFPFYYFFN